MLARFTIVAMLVAVHVQCALGVEKQLDFFRNALRGESEALARRLQNEKPDPFKRPPVRKLARSQAILGDIDGALKTASIPQAAGDRGQAARFEALGDVAEVVAGGSNLRKAMSIVEGTPPAVKIRVLLAFAVANAKRKVPSVKEAFKSAHVLARKLRRRAKVNGLRSIAAAESQAGDSKGSLRTCMQALEAARRFTSPRERAWTLTSIARTMVATGHKDAAARLADETLSVIEKISGMQADEIKADAKSDLALVLNQGPASQKTADQRTTESVKKLLSAGKYAKALEETKHFKTDFAWGESMLRIALALARNGDMKQARKIVRGLKGGLLGDRGLEWFDLKKPNTWTDHWTIDAGREMKTRVAAAAIPVWYELEADGELKKSPVESIDFEKLKYHWALVKALAKADAYAGDPGVVTRWTAPFLDTCEPGESERVSLVATIATQTAKRLKEPVRVRRKKSPVKAAAVISADGNDKTLPVILQRRLTNWFDLLTADPKSYQVKVSKECDRFPEGDIFPYTLPAIAYANMVLSDPLSRTNALKQMSGLLAPAIASTIAKVKPPAGDLAKLKSYKKHATYLGQLNMALGYYRLIGGDDRYEAINKAISDALHQALVELKGRPLESFPTYSWTFDTIPALVSLKLYDYNSGTERSDAVIRRHLDWISKNAIHKPTNLPYSRINAATGKGIALPRGCDLSWRISLIAHLDARLAKTMYDDYVKSFWLDRKIVSGFAEWPGGKGGKQDVDSGPIIMGIGMTASGMGLAASTAAGDTHRRDQLAGQAFAFKTLVWEFIEVQPKARPKLTLGGWINPSGNYVTCFLYGDACLFYAATWQALPVKKDQPTTKPKPTDSP